jgi:hypothetical protein
VRNKQYKLQNAQVQDDTFYYKNRVATATTVDELINDDRFLKVLAYANGFEDMYNGDRQRLRDILRSDMTDPNSVARTGSVKELELALKYNFGASGDQYDVNGNPVTVTDDGKLTNTGEGTALAAGLAKLRGLVIDPNGNAAIDPDTTKLVLTAGPSASDTTIYSRSQTKTLLKEKTAPEESSLSKVYEFDGAEFQKFRERKDVQKESEYFKENIGSVETVDELFESRNHRLLKFVLSAYDLESEAQYPGKIRKILESDLTDIDSLANRFKDPRFLQLTKDLNMNFMGVDQLKLASTAQDLTTRYERIAYEKNLDEQAPGVRAAIEFKPAHQGCHADVPAARRHRDARSDHGGEQHPEGNRLSGSRQPGDGGGAQGRSEFAQERSERDRKNGHALPDLQGWRFYQRLLQELPDQPVRLGFPAHSG